jgi:hypothetical protein
MEKIPVRNSDKQKIREAIDDLAKLHEQASNLVLYTYPKNLGRLLRAANAAVAEYNFVIQTNTEPTPEEIFRQLQEAMSDNELLQEVDQQLSELCKSGGNSFTMSIPPSVKDFDMLISELIRRFKEKGGK